MLLYRSFQCYQKEIYDIISNRYVTSVVGLGWGVGWGRGGVLLGVIGGGEPHGSSNPDPTSDQKNSFFTPVFRPGL